MNDDSSKDLASVPLYRTLLWLPVLAMSHLVSKFWTVAILLPTRGWERGRLGVAAFIWCVCALVRRIGALLCVTE
jgi:lysylphosphatidylglycerol synthetase-like protein (DUF2156 family)